MKKRLTASILAAALLLSGCSGFNGSQPDESSLKALETVRPAGEKHEAAEDMKSIKTQGKLSDGTAYTLFFANELELDGDTLSTSLKTENALNEILKNVTVLRLNVKEVGDGTCSDLSTIQEVYLGNEVRKIGNNAFSKCTALNKVVFSTGMEEIGDYAFLECSSLWSADIPQGITSMGRSLFADCKALRSISIASDVGESSMENCVALEKITFEEDCKIIGPKAFSGCTGLKNLILGQNVERIEDRAFSGCENIEYIYLPASLNYVGHFVMMNANRIKDVECQNKYQWNICKKEKDSFNDSHFYWPKLRETKNN